MLRQDERKSDELRPVVITPHFNRYAEGSVLIQLGNTKVACCASVEDQLPKWLQGQNRGWVTAEYGMLPRSTHERMRRDKTQGSGRTQEISRLIARSLRACVDLNELKNLQITVDCDVLQADGGTRSAAITGGFTALALALNELHRKKEVLKNPLKNQVSAISAGIFEKKPILDLCYREDSLADTDCNFVVNQKMELIEVQGTAEQGSLSRKELDHLLDMAFPACQKLHQKQREILEQAGVKLDFAL